MKKFIPGILILLLLYGAWNPFIIEVEKIAEANGLLKNKKYKDAEKAYKDALKKRGGNKKIQFNMGLTHLGMANYEEAEKDFIAVTGSDDKTLRQKANYYAGISRFHLGLIAQNSQKPDLKAAKMKYTEAADSFKRVIELDPKNEAAAHNYELCLEKIEELEKKQDQQKKKQEQKEKENDQKKKKDQKKQDKNKKQDKKKQNDQKKKDQKKKQDQKKQDQKKKQQDKKKKDDQKKKDQKKKKQDQKKKQNQQKKKPQSGKKNKPQPKTRQKKRTPEQKAALKALKDLKDRQRKRMKALYRRMGKGRRTPIKDW